MIKFCASMSALVEVAFLRSFSTCVACGSRRTARKLGRSAAKAILPVTIPTQPVAKRRRARCALRRAFNRSGGRMFAIRLRECAVRGPRLLQTAAMFSDRSSVYTRQNYTRVAIHCRARPAHGHALKYIRGVHAYWRFRRGA